MNIIHAENPFNPRERAFYFSPDELTIDEFLDKNKLTFTRPTVCIANGSEGVLKADYSSVKVSDFDTLVFVTLPEGGGGDGSNPLMLIATIALTVFAPYAATALTGIQAGATGAAGLALGLTKAAIMIGGMALINVLIPPPKPPSPHQQSREQASPVYSLQAQGNSARIDSAIPEIFGTHRIYPDFAAQPYTEYNGNDQYLYQLLCIGVGNYVINDTRIEDTPIANFSEITYEVVPPNTNVTLFPVNVETSPEVSGQELLTNTSVGGFICNASGTQTNRIGIDVVLPKGLFYANDDGGLDARSVSFTFEAATVDDNGGLTSSYAVIGSESVSGSTATPIRKSYQYPVALGRYIVKATRTSVKDTDSRTGNDLRWVGLKAYIPGDQNYGNVTMLAMRMRATNNLSQTSSRKVNLSVSRKLKTWDSINGWSASETVTSKPAWILAYIAGTSFDESRYSLLELEALQTTLDDRNAAFNDNDEFNAVFDNRMTQWEALQLVCKSFRAMPIIQGGVIHFIRDQAQTIPTAMFSMRNIVSGSFSSTYVMPSDETSDAIEVEYFDPENLKPKNVLCELNPGNSSKVAKVKLFGVTTHDHAYREGMYHASANRNRRILTTFKTELEGYIPMVGDLVAVVHDMPDWGQSGEVDLVEDYTLTQFKVHLSEPLTEGTGQHYIIFRRKDGTPTSPIACTVDAVDKTIVVLLKADVDFTLNDTGDFERTHFSFGVATEFYQRCRVIPPLKPSGNQVEINVVNESDAVHIADTGIAPALDAVFDLPPPIVKPVIATLNVTTSGTPQSPQLGMSWTPAAEADHYIIEWGLNGLEWTRAGEATTNNYILNVSPDIVHVRVAAVGLVQGDWISQTIDARLMPIPGQVQNLSRVEAFTGSQAKIKWSGAARAHSYQVEVWSGAVKRRTATTNMLEFAYTSEDATTDGGPWRNLVFNVYGLNNSGISDTVASLAVSNPAPAEMTGITVFAGYKSLILTYDPVADTDFSGVRVCMSTTPGFTPGSGNVVYEGKETVIAIPNLPEGVTQYLRLAAYDQFGKDVLNYTTTEYSGAPSAVPQNAADVLTKLNEALAEPGDNLVLTGDRFAVQLNGSNKYPLVIANVDGTDYIGISADTVIQGTLSATQITAGSISSGTDISVGDGAMVLSGNGAITIYDGDESNPNRDFAFLSGGELSFQRYFNAQYYEYKSVKRVEHGSASSGLTVTLPGYWKTQPKIIVSPNELESYKVDNTSQSQKWHVSAQNLREDPAGSGIYKFDTVAELILAANAGTDNLNQSVTQSSNSWSSSVYTLPSNTAEINVSISVKSKLGEGSDGITYYYRQVSWRVHYHDTVADTWSVSSWREVAIGANLDNTVADSVAITLPANVTEYYVEYVAANAGGTFTAGSQLYTYLTATTSSVTERSTQYGGSNPPAYHSAQPTTPAFTPSAGYAIYQIIYRWTSIYDGDYGDSSSIYWTTADNLGGLSYKQSFARAVTVDTATYNRTYAFLHGNISTPDGYSIYVEVNNAHAEIKTRKPIKNSTTADNTFNLLSVSWTLSGTSAIATGSLNYMAVEA